MSPESSQSFHMSYRKDVDGLRAIAVLGVVLYHLFPRLVPGGFIGVDVFFVISGFLISQIIWEELSTSTFSFMGFYKRRIVRIFPALLLILSATWLAGIQLLFWDEFARLGSHILSGAVFVLNISLLDEGGYFDVAAESKPLLHLWSLSIEEQFYLVWPLLLVASFKFQRHIGKILGSLLIASLIYSAVLVETDSNAAFYNPLSRIWELILGAVTGFFVGKGRAISASLASRISILSFVVLICAMFGYSKSMSFPGLSALLPTLSTACLLSTSQAAQINSSVLSNRFLVGIGLISYPWYLWHWPIFALSYTYFRGQPPYYVSLVVLGMTSILAVLTYRCVEQPLRKHRRKTKVSIFLIALMAIVGTAGFITNRQHGFRELSKFNEASELFIPSPNINEWLANVRSGTCHIQDGGAQHAEACFEPTRPIVWLWGDSHAAALYPGLRAAQIRYSFGLAQTTQSGCPPVFGAVSKIRNNCSELNRQIGGKMREYQPEYIIIAAAWLHRHYKNPRAKEDVLQKFKDSLQTIKHNLPESKIIVIGPLLRWYPNLSNVLFESAKKLGHTPPRYLSFPSTELNQNLMNISDSMRILASQIGVTYISPQDYLCEKGDYKKCLTRFQDSKKGLVVIDDSHLTTMASKFLVTEILKEVF